MTVFQTFLVFNDLECFGKYWFGRLEGLPLLELVWCILMIRLRLWIVGRKTTQVKCRFHHIVSSAYAVSLTRHCLRWPEHLAEAVFGFSAVKLLPHPHTLLFKRKSLHAAHTSGGSYVSPLWGQSIYINYLEFLCTRDLICPFSSIYLFHPLFISSWIHEYLFCTLGYNPTCTTCFLALIVPALATTSSFSWLPGPGSLWHTTLNAGFESAF